MNIKKFILTYTKLIYNIITHEPVKKIKIIELIEQF
jgi:hypothetical protein